MCCENDAAASRPWISGVELVGVSCLPGQSRADLLERFFGAIAENKDSVMAIPVVVEE
jgi:hypothetical protein